MRQDLFDTRFDAQGRQISAGTAHFRYDSLHRLIGIDRATDGAAQEVARYRYNAFGQRIAKTVVLADGKSKKTTHYFYDGSQLVFEDAALDASHHATDSGAARQYVWLNDKPVAMLLGGQILAIHTDHRNAPLALTDEARRVVWQANVADFLQASPAQGKTLGTVHFNLRGSNQYFDDESGLHYNTNRYYDPIAARYLTPDPLGLSVGPDLYAFALNRPHEMGDPLGLAPVANQDVSDWSFAAKLIKTVALVVPKLPADLSAVLLDMVSPQKVATTAAIFALWAGSHAIGIGLAFDAVMFGITYYTLGKAGADLIIGLIATTLAINRAKCMSDLDVAAATLAKAFSTATGGLIEGLLLRKVFSKTEGDLGATAIEKLKQGINYGKNKIVSAASNASKLGFRSNAWAAIVSNAERGFMGELDAWSYLISGKAKLQALCCKTLQPDLIKNSADYQREFAANRGTNGADGIFQSAPGFFKRLIGGKSEYFVLESKATAGTYRYTQAELNGLLKKGATNSGDDQMSSNWLGRADTPGDRIYNGLNTVADRANVQNALKDGKLKRVLATTAVVK